MAIKCDCCHGRGVLSGMGGIEQKCANCAGVGFKKEEKIIEIKPLETKPFEIKSMEITATEIKQKPRMGRPPKNLKDTIKK